MPFNGDLVTDNMYPFLHPHFRLETDNDSIKTSSHFISQLNQKSAMNMLHPDMDNPDKDNMKITN
jgi:NRPS condensation-like uncharacterized protein